MARRGDPSKSNNHFLSTKSLDSMLYNFGSEEEREE
ncbi:uncharacterized protein G2W53_028063 [Senna tora]|uniref:Uncharacterized protein n=1 Tax=Senna tora TaxID=362788 RepID=A0A834TBT9_9FABA|nr:uncharacterized protein G2W53_028063 [Senna tora]